MSQFYASLERRHTTASVALKRFVGYPPRNRFYGTNGDLGRVFKTQFILSYMSKPQLRARIRRGLLKAEQLHVLVLTRDVHYGRRGLTTARDLHEQMNSCSCLTLILAYIIHWQTKEISRIINACEPVLNDLDSALLPDISPIDWENVIHYGQYVIDRKLVR